MKKAKAGKTPDRQLIELLEKVLPKAIDDPKLAGKIYEAFVREIQARNRGKSFDEFCARCPLPNLEPAAVEEVQKQLSDSFKGADVTVKPNKKEQVLTVEVAMPDGAQFTSMIKVKAEAEQSEEQEVSLKFIPFPVALPGDKELVWYLSKQENLSPEEAAIKLNKVEEDFWASKAGQKLIRDRVEATFPEFISRVPAAMLSDNGLKRHYKQPEAVKVIKIHRR